MSRVGMTLMELIVGLTVTGMALAGGYAAFASIVDGRERAERAAAAALGMSALRAFLESWLGGARVGVDPSQRQFRGLDGVREGFPDDELWFLTTAATPLDARETIVRLYVDRDPDTPERGLTVELSEPAGMELRRIEIEPRATGLDIAYRSGVLGGPRWLPSWISTTALPDGLRLELSPAPGDSLPALLRLPLLVPLGNAR